MFVFVFIPLVTLVFLCIRMGDYPMHGWIDQLKFQVSCDDSKQNIKSWFDRSTKEYLVFLPSYVSTDIIIEHSCSAQVQFDDIEITSGMLFYPETDKVYSVRFINKGGKTKWQGSLVFMKSANIPAMFIGTDTGTMRNIDNDKSISEPGTILLVSPDGSVIHDGKIVSIGGRGNSTWLYPKKPYNIKLADPADLLNSGAGINWTLIANYFDDSNIRNQLTYDMAIAVGLPYSTESGFIDLYFNGEYNGLYQLADRISVGSNSVDINDLSVETADVNTFTPNYYSSFEETTSIPAIKGYRVPNNPTNITGGYLLEMENSVRYTSEPSGFITRRGQRVVLKNPKYASCEQVSYIGELSQQFEDAIYSADGINPSTGKSFSDYIDVDSWVKKYLIDEITKNMDSGNTSSYYYKPDDSMSDKIYAGPVWDYDIALGNASLTTKHPEGLYASYVGRGSIATSLWFPQLYKHEQFYNTVVFEYENTFLPVLKDIIENRIDYYMNVISSSSKMDAVRWKDSDKSCTLGKMVMFDSLDDHALFFKDYLQKRIDFLNGVWLNNEKYYTISILGPRYYYYNVRPGQPFPDLSDLKALDSYFIGFYYENTTILFDETEPITQDLELVAKWKTNGNAVEVAFSIISVIYNNRYVGYTIVILAVLSVFIFVYFRENQRNKREDKC